MQNPNEFVVCFAHLGNYHLVIYPLLKRLLKNATIMPPPPITKKTLELGARYSPDYVCNPFKYNLGNFIEGLQNGANVIIQAGGGCRFSFYGTLQQKILQDLNYSFTFINLSEQLSLKKIMHSLKKINPRLTYTKLISSLLLATKLLKTIDKADQYIAKNTPYQKNKNQFKQIKSTFFNDLSRLNNDSPLNPLKLNKLLKNYLNLLKNVELNHQIKPLKVGLIGELYSLIEPNASHFLEKELTNNQIEVSRLINATFLLFKKEKLLPKTLKNSREYLKYHIGADGTDSISHAITLAKQGYHGLIHLKPFACTPEVNAIPMLNNISTDYNIPILHLSFDSQTSNQALKTRLEAFLDMISTKQTHQNSQ